VAQNVVQQREKHRECHVCRQQQQKKINKNNYRVRG